MNSRITKFCADYVCTCFKLHGIGALKTFTTTTFIYKNDKLKTRFKRFSFPNFVLKKFPKNVCLHLTLIQNLIIIINKIHDLTGSRNMHSTRFTCIDNFLRIFRILGLDDVMYTNETSR